MDAVGEAAEKNAHIGREGAGFELSSPVTAC
jgi:hypothetical protein